VSFSRIREYVSTIKFAEKAPKKKKKTKRATWKAFWKFSLKASSTKKAKCPVTFVVNFCTEKNPTTFTKPATKESKDAIPRLCAGVLVFPMCENITHCFY